jgi:hypothetical protein
VTTTAGMMKASVVSPDALFDSRHGFAAVTKSVHCDECRHSMKSIKAVTEQLPHKGGHRELTEEGRCCSAVTCSNLGGD